MFSLTLGANIDYWMKMRGLNQTELAELAGVSTKTVRNMISHDYSGHIDNYVSVCRAMNISPFELLMGPGYRIIIEEIADE